MATPKQIEANRRNAQLSTGPRTEAGKAAASKNALKSGMHARSLVIFDENISDLETLFREYFDRFQPATPEERALVDTLANAEWILRRLRRIEPELWQTTFNNYDRHNPTFKQVNTPLAFIYTGIAKDLDQLQIRINSFDRAYHRALTDLTRLQKERKAAETAETADPISHSPAPGPRPPAPASPIGFVSQNRRPALGGRSSSDPHPAPTLGHLPQKMPSNYPTDVEKFPTSPVPATF
jgi:hypothetical protein